MNMLNEKQQLFFEELRNGSNILITGEAGTGKSFCIKELINQLISQDALFGVTATTGIAALSIGGSTIHSWAGIGLGDDSAENLVEKIRKMGPIRKRISKVKILIIDEVSLLSADLLNKLDYIFKKIRYKNKPFGGIQMIFSGDFLQLPIIDNGSVGKFAFESSSWKEGSIKTILLTEQVRQKGDNSFAEIMSEVRIGDTRNIHKLLGNQPVFPDDGIKPIVLYCLNKFVENYNNNEVAKLSGAEKKYYCNTKGDKNSVETLKKSCPALDVLSLKVGAQVILLKNIDVEEGLVNGSLGIVKRMNASSVLVKFEHTEFEVERHDWELKKQSIGDDGGTKFKSAATLNQIPLKLAYSITCHKSIGLTLSRVILDATGIFDHGIAYVALSRVRDKNSLIVKNLDINKVTAHPKALEFYGYSKSNTPKFLGFAKKEKEIPKLYSAEDEDPFLW